VAADVETPGAKPASSAVAVATTSAKEILRRALEEINAALARSDLQAAAVAMRAANEACEGLRARREFLDTNERMTFEALAATCGSSLTRAGQELQASSNKRENIRKGMSAYLKSEV